MVVTMLWCQVRLRVGERWLWNKSELDIGFQLEPDTKNSLSYHFPPSGPHRDSLSREKGLGLPLREARKGSRRVTRGLRARPGWGWVQGREEPTMVGVVAVLKWKELRLGTGGLPYRRKRKPKDLARA